MTSRRGRVIVSRLSITAPNSAVFCLSARTARPLTIRGSLEVDRVALRYRRKQPARPLCVGTADVE